MNFQLIETGPFQELAPGDDPYYDGGGGAVFYISTVVSNLIRIESFVLWVVEIQIELVIDAMTISFQAPRNPHVQCLPNTFPTGVTGIAAQCWNGLNAPVLVNLAVSPGSGEITISPPGYPAPFAVADNPYIVRATIPLQWV